MVNVFVKPLRRPFRGIQVLVDTGVFHNQRVACFPVDTAAVMHVVSPALQHIKYRAVHMAMTLAIAAWRKAIDMALNRLRHLSRAGIDDLFAEILRAAF